MLFVLSLTPPLQQYYSQRFLPNRSKLVEKITNEYRPTSNNNQTLGFRDARLCLVGIAKQYNTPSFRFAEMKRRNLCSRRNVDRFVHQYIENIVLTSTNVDYDAVVSSYLVNCESIYQKLSTLTKISNQIKSRYFILFQICSCSNNKLRRIEVLKIDLYLELCDGHVQIQIYLLKSQHDVNDISDNIDPNPNTDLNSKRY